MGKRKMAKQNFDHKVYLGHYIILALIVTLISKSCIIKMAF